MFNMLFLQKQVKVGINVLALHDFAGAGQILVHGLGFETNQQWQGLLSDVFVQKTGQNLYTYLCFANII